MTIKCKQCGNDNPDDSNFCEWCGAKLLVPAVSQVLYRLRFKGNVIEVSESSRTFGRQDFVNYLPESEYKFISRKHFTITKEGDRFYIQDENSANGTQLNGEEIKGRGKRELRNGDRIRVADTVELEFSIGGG